MTLAVDTDAARLARIARQHAESARLLGVDFVPAYRVGIAQVASRPCGCAQEAGESAPRDAPAAAEARQGSPAKPAIASTASGPEASNPRTTSRRKERDAASAAGVRTDSDLPKAKRLAALLAQYETDAPHQHFETDFQKIVFGDGDPDARLMFIGEAPGADEDRVGRPFVGRAGQLLDKMITAMGLSRDSVYIANVLKTRPPNNRTPTLEEATACAPYLYEQVRIVGPEAIVTLGAPASKLLLGTQQGIGKLRGVWASFPPASEGALIPASGVAGGFEWDREPIPVMPTYHPAFLLRSYTSENRKKVWADLKQVMDRLGLAP